MNKRAMIGAAVILGAVFFLKSRNANASEAPAAQGIAAGEPSPADSGGFFGGLGSGFMGNTGSGGYWQGPATSAGSLGDSGDDEGQLPVTPTTQGDAGEVATNPDAGPATPLPYSGSQTGNGTPILPQRTSAGPGPSSNHFVPHRALDSIDSIQKPAAKKAQPRLKSQPRKRPVIKRTPGNGTPITPQRTSLQKLGLPSYKVRQITGGF